MSFVHPRGRHRAPSKVSSSINSTVRVSGVFAIGGGLVASAAFAQSAQAASGTEASNVSVSQVAVNHAAHVTTAPAAVSQINDAVTVDTRISAVAAKTYVAPVASSASASTDSSPATSARATTSTRRAAVEPVRTSRSAQRSTTRDTPSRKAAKPAAEQQNVPAATGGVISIAKQYVGVPYVYGGSTPSGFDCSGFTGYVFAKIGVSLPRTARAQQAFVTHVSSPQPGDLVFFGSPAHHIGIYLGNNMMIAAPQPGGSVRIQPIYDTPTGYGRP